MRQKETMTGTVKTWHKDVLQLLSARPKDYRDFCKENQYPVTKWISRTRIFEFTAFLAASGHKRAIELQQFFDHLDELDNMAAFLRCM